MYVYFPSCFVKYALITHFRIKLVVLNGIFRVLYQCFIWSSIFERTDHLFWDHVLLRGHV
jgi:hypothetical protein